MLVEHVLEVGARENAARLVARAAPGVEGAALELGHVPRLAGVVRLVVVVVVGHDRAPVRRVRAVEVLGVRVLYGAGAVSSDSWASRRGIIRTKP